MKKYLLYLLVAFLFCSHEASAQVRKIPEIPRISAHSAYLKYKQGNVIIIDVMTKKSYAKQHIFGAFNLPGDEGPAALELIKNAELPFPKNKEIILYCM